MRAIFSPTENIACRVPSPYSTPGTKVAIDIFSCGWVSSGNHQIHNYEIYKLLLIKNRILVSRKSFINTEARRLKKREERNKLQKDERF